METQTAKVIPWDGGTGAGVHGSLPESPRMAAIDDIVIVVSDDQLDALAATFLMSPLRKAMTFEAYLAVKGFAREVR